MLNARNQAGRANIYGLLFIFNNCNDDFVLLSCAAMRMGECVLCVFVNACYCILDGAEFSVLRIDFIVCIAGAMKKKAGTSALSRILFHRCQIMV